MVDMKEKLTQEQGMKEVVRHIEMFIETLTLSLCRVYASSTNEFQTHFINTIQ